MTVVFDQYQYNVSVHPFATSSEKKSILKNMGSRLWRGKSLQLHYLTLLTNKIEYNYVDVVLERSLRLWQPCSQWQMMTQDNTKRNEKKRNNIL